MSGKDPHPPRRTAPLLDPPTEPSMRQTRAIGERKAARISRIPSRISDAASGDTDETPTRSVMAPSFAPPNPASQAPRPRSPEPLQVAEPRPADGARTTLHSALLEVRAAFADRFEVIEQIGRGGMGAVFAARQPGTGRVFALKVLHGMRNEKDYLRFEREMNLTARIAHPNVIQVYDYGKISPGLTFYTMEMVRGRSLFELLKHQRMLPLEQILRIMSHVALGLAAAHEAGVIHRDIKPENIMVSRPVGFEDFAQILDFGIARELRTYDREAPSLTSGGVFLGTPRYASPEAIRAEKLSPATDLYSFGCLLYQLLAGRYAFDGANNIEIMDGHLKKQAIPIAQASPRVLPGELVRLVGDLLQKRPEHRPANMMIVHAILNRSLESLLSTGTPHDSNGPQAIMRRRSPSLDAAIARPSAPHHAVLSALKAPMDAPPPRAEATPWWGDVRVLQVGLIAVGLIAILALIAALA